MSDRNQFGRVTFGIGKLSNLNKGMISDDMDIGKDAIPCNHTPRPNRGLASGGLPGPVEIHTIGCDKNLDD